jgi:hypothetical protein
MLQALADFPNPGARGLLIEGVKARPVRIHQIVPGRAKGANREAIVTLLDRDGVASGTKRVKLGELENANPLNEAEEAELAAFETEMSGKPISERSPKYKRYMTLFLRRDAAAKAAELERLKGREPRQPWSGRARG